jgi:hypothetical protein
MMKRVGTTFVVLLAALAVLSTVAVAKKTPQPTKVLRCPKGYELKYHRVRVKRHGHKVWVGRARCAHKKAKAKATPKPPTTTPAPTISYHAAVDPSFTRGGSNALLVTYDYSADAIETEGAQTINLASEDQLPSGVLNFYGASTPGGSEQLYCSMNVGGATTGGDCPVDYSATGTYSVTTQYIPSGASAVTETDSETINPLSTTTSAAAAQNSCGVSSQEKPPPGITAQQALSFTGPYCSYTVTVGLTDQNGNPLTAWVGFVAETDNKSVGGRNVLPGSCTVDVNATEVDSPDCGYWLATDASTRSWTLTFEFERAGGWAGSSAQVTLTP